MGWHRAWAWKSIANFGSRIANLDKAQGVRRKDEKTKRLYFFKEDYGRRIRLRQNNGQYRRGAEFLILE